MALLKRISGWFERMLDTEPSDDDLDLSADEGLLMPVGKGAAPEPLPPTRTEPAPAEAETAPSDAEPAPAVPAEASASAPDAPDRTSAEPVSSRPAVKVVNFAELAPDSGDDDEDELSEEAAALLAEEAAAKQNPPDTAAAPADPEATPEAEAAAPAAPAAKAVGSGASGETPEQEEGAMVTASGSDELLNEFAKHKSEFAEFTDGMENYAATDLLTDAREVLGLLAKPEEDEAA